jgi:hypothetical protein
LYEPLEVDDVTPETVGATPSTTRALLFPSEPEAPVAGSVRVASAADAVEMMVPSPADNADVEA